MSIQAGLLPVWFLVIAALLAAGVVLLSLYRTNWSAFRKNHQVQHFFYIVSIVLGLMWCIRAGIHPGLGVHFIGMVAATLLMGWPLALLAGALGLSGITLAGLESFEALGVNYLVSVALPTFSGYWVTRFVQSRFPPNPFVYIFLCGFFNGALSMIFVASTTAIMLGALAVYSWEDVYHNYFRYLPLMLFPEAFLNGMFVAGLVGTMPQWLSSFDEDKYFND